ncbi:TRANSMEMBRANE PROTEIN [Salix purpurea]|uniref:TRANSMEMBRANE PROTEIN n=1 Tax=Salix purpurea TaxID=77065 RepID=A0A9Q0T367_SALPP|nr:TRANSMEMBRANE PROTEIN [Salix purpurea]
MAEQKETVSSSANQSSNPQDSPEEKLKQPSVPPAFSGFPAYADGGFQMYPIMYPALVPGLNPMQNQEQANHGPGIYAVAVPQFMGHIAGLPSNTLIPLTLNVPTRPSPEAWATGDQAQGGQPQQQQQHPAHPRQIVGRRFQIAFQLDLLLIIKLVAVIFLFNQDGSRQRLLVLVLLASLVYLYQTGALTPLVRWLSQSMQRAAVPPPRPAVRVENAGAARQNENIALAEGQAGVENENRPAEDGNQAAENENAAEPGGDNGGHRWWGIVKEIQMIVVGFITSLLPGFHNLE